MDSTLDYFLPKTRIGSIIGSKTNNWPTLDETPNNLTFFLGSPTWILLCAPSYLLPLPSSFLPFFSFLLLVVIISIFFNAPLLTFICANNHQHLPSCPRLLLCLHLITCYHSLPHHHPLTTNPPITPNALCPLLCFLVLFCYVKEK